jgi:hypothetical protein
LFFYLNLNALDIIDIFCVLCDVQILFQCFFSHSFYNLAGSIDDASVKGSVIMGPEGEIINVGGTIKPHLRDIDMVQDANKVFGKGIFVKLK